MHQVIRTAAFRSLTSIYLLLPSGQQLTKEEGRGRGAGEHAGTGRGEEKRVGDRPVPNSVLRIAVSVAFVPEELRSAAKADRTKKLTYRKQIGFIAFMEPIWPPQIAGGTTCPPDELLETANLYRGYRALENGV